MDPESGVNNAVCLTVYRKDPVFVHHLLAVNVSNSIMIPKIMSTGLGLRGFSMWRDAVLFSEECQLE